MIIGRSSVTMAAYSRSQVEYSRTERLRAWDNRAAQAQERSRARQREVAGPSPAPPARARGADCAGGPAACADDQLPVEAKYTVLIALVEKLTGRKIQLLDPSELNQPPRSCELPASGAAPARSGAGNAGSAPQGWGIDYQLTEVRREQESSTFAAAGQVTTADGRTITFGAQLTLNRSKTEVTDVRVRAGDALRDPLVLNFGGAPIALSPSKVELDLDGDGATEHFSFVDSGNGFLALDANGNGRVDNGTELFGPATGNGFAELARHDADGNGWIDEADPVYGQLRIWDSPDGALNTLAERGVGAIALDRVATPFHLEAGGETAGVIRSTGVWLNENGAVGTIHQIDLVT